MTGSSFSPEQRQGVYRAIHERRDIRSYLPDPIPAEVLARILEAAHRAPSVGFMQPWNFVLVRSMDVRRRVHAHFLEANAQAARVYEGDRQTAYQALKLQGILDAPLNILVTCDPTRGGEHVLGRHTMRQTDEYSTCLAVQNLWLAARAEGVGVGWMSIMDPAAVCALLGAPPHVLAVAYLTLGYPVEFASEPLLSQVGWRQRLPLEELVFEDRWGARASSLMSAPWPQTAAGGQGLTSTPSPAAPAIDPDRSEAAKRNAQLIKPLGSLGGLEALALKLAALQNTAYPRCEAAQLVLFAGDHGVTEEAVSAYKRETTVKMVYSYLAGGAVVNAFARQAGVPVHVVDVGVDHDFGQAAGLVQRKVRRGTRNFVHGPALTRAECEDAIAHGRAVISDLPSLDVLLLGEMGIGNSCSAAALASALLNQPPERMVGRGTGLDDAGQAHKREVVARALLRHQAALPDPTAALACLGGLEIAALVGAMEAAAQRGVLVLLDGFIVGTAALVAVRRAPALREHLVAAHRSAEPGHGIVLDALGLTPLLALDMRLGEGSGAALALGLVRAACAFMREVRTFEEANIARPERR